jgi:hypothetical protein
VRTATGQEGWVSAVYLASVDALTEWPETAGSQVIGRDAPAATVDPNWERSPRRGTAMRNATSDAVCPARGAEGGDAETFVLKNRVDIPFVSYAVAWSALRGLPLEDGVGVAKDRTGWTATQRAAIARVEGVALSVTGFLAAVKPQGGSSAGEGTNCHFRGEANTDWHIALTEHVDDPESAALVVEPTPRIKRLAPGWTKQALRAFTGAERDPTDSVRITGFLFYDPDHRNHIGRYRFTMWELHPVTKIEVFSNGRWIDLRRGNPE